MRNSEVLWGLAGIISTTDRRETELDDKQLLISECVCLIVNEFASNLFQLA